MQILVCVISAGLEYRAIVSHCGRSLESQQPLGEAALITRYDYSWGNVCLWVGGGEICVGVMTAISTASPITLLSYTLLCKIIST